MGRGLLYTFSTSSQRWSKGPAKEGNQGRRTWKTKNPYFGDIFTRGEATRTPTRKRRDDNHGKGRFFEKGAYGSLTGRGEGEGKEVLGKSFRRNSE